MQVYPRDFQQGYVYDGYQNHPYFGAQVPLFQNPPYLRMQVPISHTITSYPGYHPFDFNQQLPSIATPKFLDLTRLTNDPIAHPPWWSIIHTKLPSNIPKFNGNPREDASTHVMMYHLWCSSNSLNDDSIRLCLFKHNFTSTRAK